MRVPTIDRGEGAASPWGQRRPPEEAIRLQPLDAPLSGLVTKGTLLTLVTLGIYRFWYRTNLRRYYWSNTTLLGDGFEYTGTGKELLIGFLIMLAIFVPLNFMATLIGAFAGEIVGGVISALIAALILPAFIQIAIYRARGYRLSRTRYRGIRFHQTGTGRRFLVVTAKWLLLTALTFGIVLPYLREAMNRYKIENTHFGSLNASCGSNPKALMKKWLALWAVVVILLFSGGLGSVLLAGAYEGGASVESLILGAGVLAFFFWGPLFLVGLLAVAVLWQIYRVHEFRHFISTTRFGDLALTSDASAKTVIWITVKFLAMLVVLGIVFFFLLTITLNPVILLLNAFIALIGYALITEIYLRRKLWAHYVGSISLTNTSQLADIIQREGQEGSALGDSFDPGFEIAG